MNCPNCDSLSKKHGKDRKGNQRFRCLACGKTFTATERLKDKNLSGDKIELCIKLLVEGNSIISTERITGVHRDTVHRFLETVGERCLMLQETLVKNIKVANIEADEIWSYIVMRRKTDNIQGLGNDEKIDSVYTFTAIERNSKLILAWHLGNRTEQDALIFLEKLYAATELTRRFQVSTDAFRDYDHTGNEILVTKVVYAQVIKLYKATRSDEARYSPSECIGKVKNVFSKKWENLNYALALYFAYYNLCRSHKTLNDATTPAMAAGLSKSIWSLKDLIGISSK